jgi:hypothetical protein
MGNDNVAKGHRFELTARDILQHIHQHLGITSFDWRKPGYQWLTGSVSRFKCDIVGYKVDGKPIIFSCKFSDDDRAERPDAGELLLSLTDIPGSEGYLVSNIEPWPEVGKLMEAYVGKTIILGKGEGLDEWFVRICGLIEEFFIGFSEVVAMDDELRVIIKDKDENVVSDRTEK